jgi:hypothetical protein
MNAVDQYEDVGGQTGTELVTESLKLMDAMQKYTTSRSDTVNLISNLDQYEDTGGDTGTVLVDNTVRLLKAMHEKGISRSKMVEHLNQADQVANNQSTSKLVDEVLKALK